MRPTTNAIPTVDLDIWRTDPTAVAAHVDTALQRAGFLLVTGHGVDAALRAGVRAAARRFFALPDAVKQRYAVRIGGRGWLAPGVEANALVEGTQTPPDLKESFAVGPDTRTGDAAVDAVWFPPNVWPAEVPELRAVVTRYTSAMRRVADDLLELCASALGVPVATLTSLATNPTWTFNVNRYPPLTEVGQPADGQYRIGPHTDFGTVTVLDREPGAGGLQVFVTALQDSGQDHPDGPGFWQGAPYDPDALTVNIGDLLAHWTGLRWSSGRHRVLPPQAAHPDEELMSLVFFYELDHDAVVTPLAPPVGRRAGLEPVVTAPFIRERLDAISVG
ncbi:MAG TPA: 2-oxoglutarate and iron-dependent oxygenase domain-containing protein [Pseudonocardia sp.]|nr:2-oxoglutarate and iron-dependent oxygenase domain-containing protein [Pseudonocardia sp.]